MAAAFDASDGAKPPSSPWPVAKPTSWSSARSAWKTSAPARSASLNVSKPDGHDHELLEVGRVQGVLAAVEDVEHRHRQGARADAAEVAVERQVGGCGRRMRARQRHAQDRVRAELALVGRAVQLEQQAVDARLVGGVLAQQRRAR